MDIHTSQPEFLPTTREIQGVFDNEIAALGGTVSDAYHNGSFLYLRAVLESSAEVGVGDRVQAGIALRSSGMVIQVHPYTVRLVCTNGAIMEHALESRSITRVEVESSIVSAASYECATLLAAVGEAVRECARPEAFIDAVRDMRSAAESQLDTPDALWTLFERVSSIVGPQAAMRLLEHFNTAPDPDRSAFGLVNAVTALARETRDPETRWRLEALGGGMPAWLLQAASVAPSAETLAVR